MMPPGFTAPGVPINPPGHWTVDEIRRWAHNRRPHEWEKVPEIGERLLLRETDFGESRPAVVVAVQDIHGTPHDHWKRHGGVEETQGSGDPDLNVWYWDGSRYALKPDPWPLVQVKVSLGIGEDGEEHFESPRWCREARVRGSSGWLREGTRAHTGMYELWVTS